MTPVEELIYEKEGDQREVLILLHDLLVNELELLPKIRWKIPFYFRKSWICYLNPLKTGAVDLGFVRGNELSNALGLLESKGRKQILTVEFKTVDEIPLESLMEILQEAMVLDENVKYNVRKNKK